MLIELLDENENIITKVESPDPDADLPEFNRMYGAVVWREYVEVVPQPVELSEQEKINIAARSFLSSTDWHILRHLGQKTLGLETSLSEEEYLQLEQDRQNNRNSII